MRRSLAQKSALQKAAKKHLQLTHPNWTVFTTPHISRYKERIKLGRYTWDAAIIGIALAAELSGQNLNIGGLFKAVRRSCSRVTNCGFLRSRHAVLACQLPKRSQTTFNGLIGCSLTYDSSPHENMITGVTFKSLNVKTGCTRTVTFSPPGIPLIFSTVRETYSKE